MKRKPQSLSGNVIEFAGRSKPPQPPDGPSNSPAKGKRFAGNQETRRSFLALMLGPLGYNFFRAIEVSRHGVNDGLEQLAMRARRDYEREQRLALEAPKPSFKEGFSKWERRNGRAA